VKGRCHIRCAYCGKVALAHFHRSRRRKILMITSINGHHCTRYWTGELFPEHVVIAEYK
jgi:hypothetical protein